MKLWNNLKWLCKRDLYETVSCDTLDYQLGKIESQLSLLRHDYNQLLYENVQAAESVFPDNGLWMFASVAELFKENRVETYTVKAIRLLNNAGIHSVAQLTTQTERDLRKIKGMGTNTIGYIQDSLARQGLALGGK